MATKAPRTPRLVLFNHKGGVGKTTLTVNLAFALASADKRVLLVDTDPQCSLSSYFLDEEYLDDALDSSETEEGNTIWTALRPVSTGEGPAAPIKAVKIRENLWLAVGDIRLSEYENSLATCWMQCLERNRRGYSCTGALSKLVDSLASATKADFIFFDAGPNIGPLNRAILLDCTHFIIPAACDLFSTRALKTLGFSLYEWISIWNRVREIAPDGSPLLVGKPQLLGYIPQGFKTYGGDITEGSAEALEVLESRVYEFVWKKMQEAYGLPTTERPDLRLGLVKFLGDLAPKSQSQGVPIWDVEGGNDENKQLARRVFNNLAKKLVTRTS